MDETNLKIINMSDVESKEISWLWYPFIPYGKLTIIQGDPGEGKTTLVLNIAAVLSKGQGLDEHMKQEQPLHIIYQTAEDGLAKGSARSLESDRKSTRLNSSHGYTPYAVFCLKKKSRAESRCPPHPLPP